MDQAFSTSQDQNQGDQVESSDLLRDLEIEFFTSCIENDLDLAGCREILDELEQVVSERRGDEEKVLKSLNEVKKQARYQADIFRDDKSNDESNDESNCDKSSEELNDIKAKVVSSKEMIDQLRNTKILVQNELRIKEVSHQDLQKQVESVKCLNDDIVQPVVIKRKLELEVAKEEALTSLKDLEKARLLQGELASQLVDLQSSCDGAMQVLQEKKASESRLKVELNEIRTSIDLTKKSAANLQDEIKIVSIKVASARSRALEENTQRRNVCNTEKDAKKNLERQDARIKDRKKEFDSIVKALSLAQAGYHSLTATRLEQDIKLRDVLDSIRHGGAAALLHRKQLDRLMRLYLKKKAAAETSRVLVKELEIQLVDEKNLSGNKVKECEIQSDEIEKIKDEQNIKLTQLLQQRNIEDKMKTELESILGEVESKEVELDQWRTEVRKLTKISSILHNQHQIQMQKTKRIVSDEKEILAILKLKRFEVLDTQKALNESGKRIKEFDALYEIIKRKELEIRSVSSSLVEETSEIQEKNCRKHAQLREMEKAHNEKKSDLKKERGSYESSKSRAAKLRVERRNIISKCRERQEELERQEFEVDHLQNILRDLNRDIEQANDRNRRLTSRSRLMSNQLEDKKIDLRSLLRRSNIYEETLKKGDLAIQQKKEEIRMLKVQCIDLERYINTKQNIKSDIKICEEKAKELEDELENELQQKNNLSRCLENPDHVNRYRNIGGEDMDKEQIASKTKLLLQRLSQSKRQLLEREVAIEELKSSTYQLESEIELERIKTQPAVRKLNDYQVRVREITRSMMALVSELSMYQATVLKLEEQKEIQQEELVNQNALIAEEQLLSETDIIKHQELHEKRSQGHSDLDPCAQLNEFGRIYYPSKYSLRTSAEPRPSAYIPDVGLEVPKPFGGMAPFMGRKRGH